MSRFSRSGLQETSVAAPWCDLFARRLGKPAARRQQSRVHSQGATIRPGGGLRLFPLDQLGVGMDFGLPLGFLVHQVFNEDGVKGKTSSFLLGIEVLPLVVEYRF